jgi:L-arabinose isomerase
VDVMSNIKVGLLPLYIELYDLANPKMRVRIDAFRETIIRELEKRELEVVAAPICRIKPEFEKAVNQFEKEDVDAIITLHLAYSPSLESSEVLARTHLPIIVLDTTPTYNFSPSQAVEEISYNHGIHGVQDMCNLLIRNKKRFFIEAGHWEKSDVLDRIVGCARAVKLAKNMKTARVGRIGEAFEGMGDFAVPANILCSTIGVETIAFDKERYRYVFEEITCEEIDVEIQQDLAKFEAKDLDNEAHKNSTLAGLGIRKWIEKEKLTAFTVNFLAVDKASGIPTVPFLEASKAMSRGIGYAGEGDVLTAALVGTLLSVYPETSFTEMFCPDWENNSIFLSHMGEANLDLMAEKPELVKHEFPYTDACKPVVAHGRFKEGEVTFVDLAPGPDNTYSLIISKGNMLGVEGEDSMKNSIHGWFKPGTPVADFLKNYSVIGGTHHAALIYGDVTQELKYFGELMGWETVEIC